MTRTVSYRRRVSAANFAGFSLVPQGVGIVAKSFKVHRSGVAVKGSVGMRRIAYGVQHYLKIHWSQAASADGPRSGPGGADEIVQEVSYYATEFLPIGVGTYCPAGHTASAMGSPYSRTPGHDDGRHHSR
jgi:hypothetical protein